MKALISERMDCGVLASSEYMQQRGRCVAGQRGEGREKMSSGN
jgi:hypothetical protein